MREIWRYRRKTWSALFDIRYKSPIYSVFLYSSRNLFGADRSAPALNTGTRVVDDDVNVADLEQLMWAALTRADPATSIDFITGAWTSPADPRVHPDERAQGNLTNSRMIIDACIPFHWRDRFPAINRPSAEAAAEAVRTTESANAYVPLRVGFGRFCGGLLVTGQ